MPGRIKGESPILKGEKNVSIVYIDGKLLVRSNSGETKDKDGNVVPYLVIDPRTLEEIPISHEGSSLDENKEEDKITLNYGSTESRTL